MTEMDELKPCPFCGYAPTGEEELLDILDVDEFGEKVEKIKYVGVSCAGCCAYVPIQTHDKTEAIAAWNRRSPSPVSVGVKALEWEDRDGKDEDGGYDVIGASADHELANYWITYADTRRDEIWLLMRDRGHVVGHYMEMKEAKAAAQADYEQRILSTLTLSPAGVTEEQVDAALKAKPRNCTLAQWLDMTHISEAGARELVRAALEAAAKAQPSFKQGRRMMPGYTDFDTWFHEQEGVSLRSERFNGDVEWLKAAFDAGRSAQPSISTGQGEPVMWVPARVLEAVQYRGTTAIAASNSQNEVTDTPLYTHPSLPAGQVAVPVEPTEEMIKAGLTTGTRFGPKAMRNIYRAMLSALPHNQGEGK